MQAGGRLQKEAQDGDDEVARLQRQLFEGAQLAPVRDPDELQSLRGTIEELSVTLGEGKVELQQLKILLVYE